MCASGKPWLKNGETWLWRKGSNIRRETHIGGQSFIYINRSILMEDIRHGDILRIHSYVFAVAKIISCFKFPLTERKMSILDFKKNFEDIPWNTINLLTVQSENIQFHFFVYFFAAVKCRSLRREVCRAFRIIYKLLTTRLRDLWSLQRTAVIEHSLSESHPHRDEQLTCARAITLWNDSLTMTGKI